MTLLEHTTAEHSIRRIRTKADFEILFTTHYSNLCSYANGFLKDLDASEEIVQEVMVKIWMNREDLKIKTSIESYIFRAVRNGSLNLLKHVNIREEYKSYKERENESSQLSFEDEMISTELERKIRQAIDQLPLERRKIFIMSRYDGLTYNQIAVKLDLSVKTVENQMGKALKFLREELSDYLPWLLLLLHVFKN